MRRRKGFSSSNYTSLFCHGGPPAGMKEGSYVSMQKIFIGEARAIHVQCFYRANARSIFVRIAVDVWIEVIRLVHVQLHVRIFRAWYPPSILGQLDFDQTCRAAVRTR